MSGLRAVDISAGYRGRPVLRAVDAEVPAGGWLGVIGPNGAGKSTLLKTLAGLLPHEGTVTVDGTSIDGLRPRQRARVLGYAPQTPEPPTGLTVTDYVLLGRSPYLPPLGREGRSDLRVVAEVLARLDLAGMATRPLATLSGGERQRAVLARVLAQQPRVLLLDEPTTGLDVGHAQALLELVDRLRREDGVTVVTTLHDLTLAAQYADRLVFLVDGAVTASGAPGEVLTQARVAEHYQASVAVLTSDGSRIVAPVRHAGPRPAPG
ncbi:ABC transporter ATP-binding protein [Actinoalloteichus caeruleus]|uniref:Iron complex transport system ATP-binding protein n=1 Tax=Actinoalloteichus caeruleus DSM 43889 TaxID=1120930 RepID=A0ABT1JGE2_ACTCY|nr:ABC transporter ATP-binding protein [Actinoalloteichus caeruleus]MCP2331560.1 iron complex transport system ATP-binding protein [Actinoalloteichus caeruleus DSM 43889]